MSPLRSIGAARHVGVGLVVAGAATLGFTGVVGSERREERFDAKQVVIAPSGADGVAIREVVDIDFGAEERRGYQRIIPTDFGVPTDIGATATDASADIDVQPVGGDVRIRIGDPDETITGRHRYVLEYILPDAMISTGRLGVDVIGTDETLETERFEVVVTGMTLEDPICSVGSGGTRGGCELTPDGDVYRATISPLDAGDGITIGGAITSTGPPVEVPPPPRPGSRPDRRLPVGLGMLGLGALGAGGTYGWARRRGRNEVFAGGAADAAYSGSGSGAVRLVADEDMDDLATTEFIPPDGVMPWQGAVLLRERIDDATVGAWFSGLAARDVLLIERDGDEGTSDPKKAPVMLRMGPAFDRAPADDAPLLAALFADAPEVELGKYSKDFATTWRQVHVMQERSVAASGMWKRQPPTAGGCVKLSPGLLMIAVVWLVVGAGGTLAAIVGLVSNPIAAIVFGLLAGVVTAVLAYRSLLPVRSATGSALALRTESFRRFLDASEGKHVDWAWQHGLLREYSAWAVALGAAAAWSTALAASSVPPAETMAGPLLVYSSAGAFSGAHTAPSSAGGSSGGGGFSGGSVGGGGGGGSSGSW